MPYPKRLLNQDEELALDLRPHWWYFWKHIITGIPLFIILGLIFSYLHGTARSIFLYPWALAALVWAGWLATRYANWNFTHFVVTNDRVIFRTGVFAKHGVEIPLERINNINFHQGIIERVVGAGDLDIESAGREGQSHFSDIWHPDGVQQEVYRQMEANAKKRAGWHAEAAAAVAAPPAPAPPAPAAPNIPEQIQQLADLRDRGVISAADFEAKKAQLLERM